MNGLIFWRRWYIICVEIAFLPRHQKDEKSRSVVVPPRLVDDTVGVPTGPSRKIQQFLFFVHFPLPLPFPSSPRVTICFGVAIHTIVRTALSAAAPMMITLATATASRNHRQLKMMLNDFSVDLLPLARVNTSLLPVAVSTDSVRLEHTCLYGADWNERSRMTA